MFPDSQDLPVCAAQLSRHLPVALSISLNLRARIYPVDLHITQPHQTQPSTNKHKRMFRIAKSGLPNV